MQNVLVVSDIKKHIDYFKFIFNSINITNITIKNTCKDAREIISLEFFDLILVDSPLSDELGKNFSKDVKEKTHSQIIYCVEDNNYIEADEELFHYNVITLSKPFNRKIFLSILKTCYINSQTINTLINEKNVLSKKMEEIKTIDRAKCLLISYLNMSEKQAHKYIEKQAMDHRLSKLEIATRVLKTYEG